jgi:hypothetical protein
MAQNGTLQRQLKKFNYAKERNLHLSKSASSSAPSPTTLPGQPWFQPVI